MSVHPIPGLPGISVSIPGLDVDNVSGRRDHDQPTAHTVYPVGPRPVPPRIQTARRVQETITAATGEQLDAAMHRQLQLVADDQHPDTYHAVKDLARNLAASERMDRNSARERIAPGSYLPSAGSRLPFLFGGAR